MSEMFCCFRSNKVDVVEEEPPKILFKARVFMEDKEGWSWKAKDVKLWKNGDFSYEKDGAMKTDHLRDYDLKNVVCGERVREIQPGFPKTLPPQCSIDTCIVIPERRKRNDVFLKSINLTMKKMSHCIDFMAALKTEGIRTNNGNVANVPLEHQINEEFQEDLDPNFDPLSLQIPVFDVAPVIDLDPLSSSPK